jgi:hypothetical protein
MVEPRDQGWAVYVFVCSHCRYASQPGVPLAVQEGEGTLPAGVRAAAVPVARLTGPGVEALRVDIVPSEASGRVSGTGWNREADGTSPIASKR